MTQVRAHVYTGDDPSQTRPVQVQVDVPARNFATSRPFPTTLAAMDVVRNTIAAKLKLPPDSIGWNVNTMSIDGQHRSRSM